MNETLEQLKSFGALKEGHFVLASGRHSPFYVQVAQITQYPHQVTRLIRDKVAELKRKYQIDTVFSPAIGALPLAQQVGELLECKTIFAERDAENKMALRRSFEITAGEKILLVEDVVTTGGTLFELKQIAKNAGAEIVGVFAMINRSGKPTWDEFPLEAVVVVDFPTWPAAECPLCVQGIPTERPGTKKVKDGRDY